ncbi:MAG: glycosyltransferase family 4 protein, partial [Clostridia bacterium]
RVIIVTTNVFNLPVQEVLAENIEIIRLPCHNIMKGRYPIPHRNAAFAEAWRWLTGCAVDYVIVNTRFYFHSLLGITYAQSKNIRPIIIDHGSAHLTVGNGILDAFVGGYEHIFTHFVKAHDADYYAVSTASARWLDHFGITALGVLHNSIDAKRFYESASSRDFKDELSLPRDAFIVSFFGRFIPEKGIYPLMEAARQLTACKDIHFLLAGAGSLQPFIEEQHLENVHLLGKLEEKDVGALLKSSDTFCLPSRSEGFSTSLLEAAACATAPIITDVGGVSELMPDENFGILLKYATGEEVAKAILSLYYNKEHAVELGHNIQQRVIADFSWEKTARKAEQACEQANACKR